MRQLPRPLLQCVLISAVFGAANFSLFYFLLRAGGGGDVLGAIGLYLLFTITHAVLSLPAGALSDRIGRLPVLALGYLAFVAALALLVPDTSRMPLVVPFVLYGVAMAAVEGNQRAYVADLAPRGLRATAQGAFQTAQGLSKLGGNLLAGALALVALSLSFAAGALLAVLALGLLGVFMAIQEEAAEEE
jgi:MFS family permease